MKDIDPEEKWFVVEHKGRKVISSRAGDQEAARNNRESKEEKRKGNLKMRKQ